MAGFYKVRHRLDFSFVFSARLPLEETRFQQARLPLEQTRFQQAGSFSVEGSSQVVLGSS